MAIAIKKVELNKKISFSANMIAGKTSLPFLGFDPLASLAQEGHRAI